MIENELQAISAGFAERDSNCSTHQISSRDQHFARDELESLIKRALEEDTLLSITAPQHRKSGIIDNAPVFKISPILFGLRIYAYHRETQKRTQGES